MAEHEFRRLYLRVETADLTPLHSVMEQLREHGVTFTTLAQEQHQDAECLDRLYDLARQVHSNADWTLDEYLKRFDDWDRVFIARVGALYVGYSYLVQDEEDAARLRQCMTGVRPEWRRRGIATALKLQVLIYAGQRRYTTIVTKNRAANTPILALNARLGFHPLEE